MPNFSLRDAFSIGGASDIAQRDRDEAELERRKYLADLQAKQQEATYNDRLMSLNELKFKSAEKAAPLELQYKQSSVDLMKSQVDLEGKKLDSQKALQAEADATRDKELRDSVTKTAALAAFAALSSPGKEQQVFETTLKTVSPTLPDTHQKILSQYYQMGGNPEALKMLASTLDTKQAQLEDAIFKSAQQGAGVNLSAIGKGSKASGDFTIGKTRYSADGTPIVQQPETALEQQQRKNGEALEAQRTEALNQKKREVEVVKADNLNLYNKVKNIVNDPNLENTVGAKNYIPGSQLFGKTTDSPENTLRKKIADADLSIALGDIKKLTPATDSDLNRLVQNAPQATDGANYWRNWFDDLYKPYMTKHYKAFSGEDLPEEDDDEEDGKDDNIMIPGFKKNSSNQGKTNKPDNRERVRQILLQLNEP